MANNTVIPVDQTDNVLEALYRRAHQIDMEFTASSYWQAKLQTAFPLRDGFACLCEQSPDDNDRRRIDQIIYRVEPGSLILTKILVVESKRQDQGTAHIKRAEQQLLDGCIRALNHGGPSKPYILGMTTWRTKFRLWRLHSGATSLLGMDGGPGFGGLAEVGPSNTRWYRDILSDEGMFNDFIGLAKIIGSQPLQQDSGLQNIQTNPSQGRSGGPNFDLAEDGPSNTSWPRDIPLDDQHGIVSNFIDHAQDIDTQQLQPYSEPQSLQTNPSQGPSGDPVQLDPYPPEETWVEPEVDNWEGSSSTPARSARNSRIQVTVTVQKRLAHKDLWCFRDHKGHWNKVARDKWDEREVGGIQAWVFKKGNRHYYTYQTTQELMSG